MVIMIPWQALSDGTIQSPSHPSHPTIGAMGHNLSIASGYPSMKGSAIGFDMVPLTAISPYHFNPYIITSIKMKVQALFKKAGSAPAKTAAGKKTTKKASAPAKQTSKKSSGGWLGSASSSIDLDKWYVKCIDEGAARDGRVPSELECGVIDRIRSR